MNISTSFGFGGKMTCKNSISCYGIIIKLHSVFQLYVAKFNRILTGIGILSFCIIISFISPPHLLALGEYDGMWIGQVAVSGKMQKSETGASVFYQEDSETLSIFDHLFGIVRLKKSADEWLLPTPLQTTLWGVQATLTEFNITFPSTSYMTGTATVNVNSFACTATYTMYKQSCTLLTNSLTLSSLSGVAGSYQCYQIKIPASATDLDVQTSGGTGDCDLGVIYHRPDFDHWFSLDPSTREAVEFSSPRSGLWYILLIGYTNFSGVDLSILIEVVSRRSMPWLPLLLDD